jgi:hypothetical protein
VGARGVEVGSQRCCSPCHWMPFRSRNERSQTRWMTWRGEQHLMGPILRRHYSLVVEPFNASLPAPGAAEDDEKGTKIAAPPPLGVDNGVFLARDHYALPATDVDAEGNEVGLCRLSVSKSELKARLISA